MNKFPNRMKIEKKVLLMLGLLSLGITGCNSDGGQSDALSSSETAATPITSTPMTVAEPVAVSNTDNISSGAEIHPPTKLGQLMNLNAPKNFSGSTSGLNPAHGMPGHDCAVSVGAPLPKAAVTVSQPVAATPALSAPVAATPNLNANLKNINPAHGQPGHDCAVAVGDPLPAAGSSQAAVPSLAAPTAATPNFGVPNGGKLNPAHGQPGHDCAVAVGAPLPG